MEYHVIYRGVILFPTAIVFIYFLVLAASECRKAISFCTNPILVKCFPFLFLVDKLFSAEGLLHRNRMLKYLLITILVCVLATIALLTVEGAWRRL